MELLREVFKDKKILESLKKKVKTSASSKMKVKISVSLKTNVFNKCIFITVTNGRGTLQLNCRMKKNYKNVIHDGKTNFNNNIVKNIKKSYTGIRDMLEEITKAK